MTHHDPIRQAARDTRRAVWHFIPVYLLIAATLAIVGFALWSSGLFGRTVVERKVFERSYQRSEALASQLATDQATVATLEHQLSNPYLDPDTRYTLETQLAAARLRIATTERKQNR